MFTTYNSDILSRIFNLTKSWTSPRIIVLSSWKLWYSPSTTTVPTPEKSVCYWDCSGMLWERRSSAKWTRFRISGTAISRTIKLGDRWHFDYTYWCNGCGIAWLLICCCFPKFYYRIRYKRYLQICYFITIFSILQLT